MCSLRITICFCWSWKVHRELILQCIPNFVCPMLPEVYPTHTCLDEFIIWHWQLINSFESIKKFCSVYYPHFFFSFFLFFSPLITVSIHIVNIDVAGLLLIVSWNKYFSMYATVGVVSKEIKLAGSRNKASLRWKQGFILPIQQQ